MRNNSESRRRIKCSSSRAMLQGRDLTCRNISFSFCVIPHYSTCECVEAAVGSAECPRWPTPPCKTTDPIPPPFPHIYGEKGHSFFSPFPSDAQSSYIIVFIPMWGERGEGGRRAGPFLLFSSRLFFWGRLKEDRGRKHIMLIMALMQEPLSGGKGKGGVRCGGRDYDAGRGSIDGGSAATISPSTQQQKS